LVLFLREWYMHPNGQIPAYEWAFGDVNPPVHAWAAWRVYKIEKRIRGAGDRVFLERVFQKLLLNFTWWVNRKDLEGKNVFQGGFLGLDNIGVFDRSAPLPTGGHIEQPDGAHPMKVRSLVGLVPLFSVQVIEPEDLARLPRFERRMRWFLDNREDLCHLVTRQLTRDGQKRRLLSLVSGERLQRVLSYML